MRPSCDKQRRALKRDRADSLDGWPFVPLEISTHGGRLDFAPFADQPALDLSGIDLLLERSQGHTGVGGGLGQKKRLVVAPDGIIAAMGHRRG